ncbi:MAG: translocation/assembly module TamB domain-containing protein [Marinilabilia sp.]
MHKILKYIIYFLSGILVLILILLLFTQTGTFRQIVQKQVLKAVNENIEGVVNFDRLEGNFFSDLSVHGLRAGLTEKDTLVSFDRLALQYSLWPLVNGTVQVHSIELAKPRVNMEQDTDSTWRWQKLFPAAKDTSETSSEPSQLTFKLGSFHLTDGHLDIHMYDRDSVIPAYLSDIDLELGGAYGPGTLGLDLEHLGFSSPSGIPDLEHFQVSVGLEDSIWSVRDFSLVTPRNRIGAEGRYDHTEKFDVLFNTAPFEMDEFAWALPDFKLGVTPAIDLTADVADNDLFIDLALDHEEEGIGLQGHVRQFAHLLSDSTRHKPGLDVSFSFRNFHPERWLLLSDFPLLLNGDIKIEGNGLAGSNAPLQLSGDFDGSRWDQYKLRELGIGGTYMDGATTIRSRIATDMGVFHVDASGNLNDTAGPFTLDLKAENFPADRFLPEWGDSTLLNLTLTAAGSGNDAASLRSDFSLLLEQSVLARTGVDTLRVKGRFDRGHLTVDTLRFLNSSGRLFAQGEYEDDSVSSEVEGNFSDLDAFSHLVNVPVRWQQLSIKGHAHGRTDSLMVDFLAGADSLRYDTLAQATVLNFSGNGSITPEGFSGFADLNLQDVESSGQEADSLMLNAELEPDEWDARLSLWLPDSLSLNSRVLGNMSSPFSFHIPELDIQTPYEDFSLEGDGPKIHLDTTKTELNGFHLTARRNGRFHIRADGRYVAGDSLKVDASVEELDLSLFESFGLLEYPLSGMASAKVNAEGSLTKPAFDMSAQFDSLVIQRFRVTHLGLDVNHQRDSLRASMVAQSPGGDSLTARAAAPMHMNLTDSQMVSTINTFEGRLQAADLQPSAFFESDNQRNQLFNAILDTDIAISGSVATPVLRGFLNVTNGELSLPAYGVKYRDMKLRTRLDSNRVVVDSLFTRRDKGKMLLSGEMAFDSTLLSGNLSDIDLALKANEFFVSKHRNHEVQMDADAWLRTIDEEPVYGGSLTILRSNFYLPALLEMGGTSQASRPLLVQALEDVPEEEQISETDTLTVEEEGEEPPLELMKELTGKINVQIPRNSWVKSEDMTLELYGDLDLLKNNDYFEVFGTLGISRGFYTLYGRKLIIREGELTFQGGEELNPQVNLVAVYQFRDKDKQKNELIMRAGGTAFEPDLDFTLNGNSITERDAMAYLVFNQSFDQLSFSNQEGVSGNLPSAMLSGLVSSQLTKTLGNTFDLDMVEVKAGDDWESATFMVGKYITNNLFVTYQRGFGESQEESLTPQTITLEYEVTRNVSLRLTQGDVKDSGIDVILKFEKE